MKDMKMTMTQRPKDVLAAPRLPRGAFLLVLALALAAPGVWVRLAAQAANVVPGGYVQIQTTATTLDQGATLQLRAAVLSPIGFELPNRKVTWKSSNPVVASVSDAGLVSGSAAGIVTITAKSGGALGTVALTVNGPNLPPPNTAPTVIITEPADGATFQQGDVITFTATADDEEQGRLDAQIVWTATAAGDPYGTQTPLGTGASVSPTGSTPGAFLVTAHVTDSGGLAGVAQVGITVNPPCTIVASLAVGGTYPSNDQPSAQNLHLNLDEGFYWMDASGSYDTCGRPLQYVFADCSTADDVEVCANFLAQATANGNTTPVSPTFRLDGVSQFFFTTLICLADNPCNTVEETNAGLLRMMIRSFYGIPTGTL
jgi:hypothetical protein